MPTTTKCPPAAPDLAVPADWMSPQQLADWFGVSVKSVYRWNQHNTGPRPTRIGKHVRYSRQAIAAWVAEQGEALT